MQRSLCVLLLLSLGFAGGCVRRVIEITSDPDGATVWLNDREVGTTPLEVEIVFYGKYDVQVRHLGYEPMTTFGSAKAPVWDTPGLDFIAEIIPASFESRNVWHFAMVPETNDAEALLQRAEALRVQVDTDDE